MQWRQEMCDWLSDRLSNAAQIGSWSTMQVANKYKGN